MNELINLSHKYFYKTLQKIILRSFMLLNVNLSLTFALKTYPQK